jgi:dephospho-CoA kinase
VQLDRDLVDAPEDVRLHRLVNDRGLPEDEARRMMAAQMPTELKRARADVVIRNSGTLGDLQDRARDAWRELQRRAVLRQGEPRG